jgi:hypothetical protein
LPASVTTRPFGHWALGRSKYWNSQMWSRSLPWELLPPPGLLASPAASVL